MNGTADGGGSLDFVALDVETANFHRGSICAFGLTIVRHGLVVETYSWLCQPPPAIGHFEPFHVGLHGIRPEAVLGQPTFLQRLDEVLEVIGELPVVAHNACFDVGAVRDGCSYDVRAWPTLTYACTLVMSRRELDLPSYRLPLVARHLNISMGAHHDAGADSLVAARIVIELAQRQGAKNLVELAGALRVLLGRVTPLDWSGCYRELIPSQRIRPVANPDADPAHELYGRVIVFTGGLSITRADAWERVAHLGAVPEQTPTRRTNILVIGDGFRGDDPSDFCTGKALRAVQLRAKGQDIEVLTEEDLIALLSDERASGTRPRRSGGPIGR